MSQCTALYRLYDVEGVLLYVGISGDPEGRFRQHEATKGWWSLVARKSVEWFRTREAALLAEEAAIKIKRPLYNVMHSDRADIDVTVTIPDRFVLGLDILARSWGEEVPGGTLARWEVLLILLARETTARGLEGDVQCLHNLSGWPSGLVVANGACPCGKPITPAGGFIPGAANLPCERCSGPVDERSETCRECGAEVTQAPGVELAS